MKKSTILWIVGLSVLLLVANLVAKEVYEVLKQHQIDWAKVGFVGAFVGIAALPFCHRWLGAAGTALALGIGVGAAIGEISWPLLHGH